MSTQKLAWGRKVSPLFCEKVVAICKDLGFEPSYLMAAIAFETGETFSPSILNKKGSGAVGLIQFMPSTALALGTSSEALKGMTAEDQLHYVHKYFTFKKGKVNELSDVYMTILWPSAVGKPEHYVLFDKNDKLHPKRYIQNAGLDFNKDGLILKSEAVLEVQDKLNRGLLPENVALFAISVTTEMSEL